MRKTFMLTAAALFAIGAISFSGESRSVEAYAFSIDGDDATIVELNSETMGFGLHDLQPGDVRTTVTEDGKTVTISRLEKSYQLDIDGNVVEIPALHESGDLTAAHAGAGHTVSRNVAIAHGMAAGLTILSKEPLDETKRDTIRNALNAAGIVDEIEFLSPGLSLLDIGSIDEDIEIDGERRHVVIKHVISD